MFELWELDFTHVDENPRVRDQGKLICIKTATKGFFSPELERYPSRQDLATRRMLNCNIGPPPPDVEVEKIEGYDPEPQPPENR